MAEAQEEEARVSVGEQLKLLREEKNLSVQSIASRLNLEVRIIEAIERNDFEQLSAATYVRGYLRNYAKMLGADPETIISTYNDEAPDPPEIIPEVKHTSQTSSSDKPVKAFTYLISLVLVILVVAWWQSKFIVDNFDLGGGDAGEAYQLSYPVPTVEHDATPYYGAITEEEEAGEEEAAVEAPAAAPEAVATTQATLDNSAAQTSAPAVPEPSVSNDVEPAPPAESAGPRIVTTDIEGPDSLVLTVTAESWIEVYDALERRVYINLARPGQVLSLKGTAPFSVLLGLASAVSVEFNGQPFDTSPHTHAGIARFNLDRE